MVNKRRGRPRAGEADGRERILIAAQELFAARGYDRTTLRAVAARAGCDPALIAYHFGSKKGLFGQVMTLALSPTAVLERSLSGDPDTLVTRLLTLVTQAWEHPDAAIPLGRLVEAAMSDEEVLRSFREYIDREIMARLVEFFGGPHATERATAVLTLVIGTIFARYVVRVPAIAQQPADQYLAALAPVSRAATHSRVGPAARRPRT
ncbi:TetR/AcrR family transcriptional regulator, partial [Intrasporangium sp.]|uniref:TetR/AcrR family transcriptional regulator n=1 Tax=Intrasporangium sp. TaxID=1925024 RepID=UPI00293B229C